MSDADIDKAIREAQEFEAQDKKRKEAVDTVNDAESFALQTEKALSEVGDKISDSERSTVQADVDAVKSILERVKADPANATDSDLDALKSAKEKLNTSAQGVFTKMYENVQAQQAGAQGATGAGAGAGDFTEAPTGNTSSSGDGDDVVDADFREV